MLNKHDLTKQFELIVQQEITNHNRQIFQSNQSIQDLEKKVKENIIRIEHLLADLDSKSQKLSRENKSITLGHETFADKMLSLVNDINSAIKALDQKFKSYCEKQEGRFLSENRFKEFLESNATKESSFKTICKDLRSEVDWVSKYLQDQVISILNKFREEISIRPKEIEELEKRLISKIESLRLDKEGIYRDINFQKRQTFVNEKHIENIYMLMGLTPKGAKKT